MKKSLILLFITLTCQFAYAQTDSSTKKAACTLDIATILTKNDGEKLRTSCPCEVKTFEFSLYDRFGKLVYSTKLYAAYLDIDISEKVKVDGKEKEKYPAGTYFWKASYQAMENGSLVDKKMTGRTEILGS